MSIRITLALLVLSVPALGAKQTSAEETAAVPPDFDAELAKELGADEYGMRHYVLVILKAGPNDQSLKGKVRYRKPVSSRNPIRPSRRACSSRSTCRGMARRL